MKRTSTTFLQIVLLLFGVGVLAFMLWEPHLEGRNKNATLFEIYFKDPFLAYVYFSSIAFFLGLYQAFKLLGYAGQNQIFSQAAIRSLRTIHYCALAVIGLVALSSVFFLVTDPEDRPQGVTLRIFLIFISIVVAAVAVMFERILQNAVEIKSENDLTV